MFQCQGAEKTTTKKTVVEGEKTRGVKNGYEDDDANNGWKHCGIVQGSTMRPIGSEMNSHCFSTDSMPKKKNRMSRTM